MVELQGGTQKHEKYEQNKKKKVQEKKRDDAPAVSWKIAAAQHGHH